MLLWFRFKNFGPFREEAFFDMRAVKAYKELPDHVMKSGNQSAVRTAAIYGANASGKSNLIKAVERFQEMIVSSMSDLSKEEDFVTDFSGKTALKKYYNPFRFDQRSTHEATEFEACVFMYNKQFQYGFAYDDSVILYEWLYVTAEDGRQDIIFEREMGHGVEFGSRVDQEECQKFISGLREQVLLLTFFDRIKLSDGIWRDAAIAMKSLFVWDVSYIVRSSKFVSKRLAEYFSKEKYKQGIINYLKQIDVNIVDFEVDPQDDREPKVYTVHFDDAKNRYLMPLEQESAGTIKALALYLLIGIDMDIDWTFFLDEINAHLHPLLTKFFVNRYYEANVKEQLIFTTHDVNLLDKKYMRRDQIWFVEKKGNEASLFSLADFKVRNDASLQKNYLSGNYGAIPILGES